MCLQSTVSGFGHVSQENVFKVCDQPQPHKVKGVIDRVREGRSKDALDIVANLWGSGYAATDIIQTLFKVCKAYDMPEPQKLEFIREIGFTHMRIAEGLNTQLQLLGCVARLSQLCQVGK
jgi:replication factor C subunit 2/4